MRKAKDSFYAGLLKQAKAMGGMVRVTSIGEGMAIVSSEDSEPKPEFDRLCKQFKDNKTAIFSHIDTVQFFTQSDWLKLRAAGATVIMISPAASEDATADAEVAVA